MLLLLTAGTTLAGALGATRWVTALLGASTIVVSVLRKVFDWHHRWISYANAWAEVRAATNAYRLLPVEQRDASAGAKLVRQVDEIIAGETTRSTSHRREATQEH